MGGVVGALGSLVGTMIGGRQQKQQVDTSALRAAEEQRKQSQMDAQRAQAETQALEERNRQRRRNVDSSGRSATILAGEGTGQNKTLLGS